ncbi:MAG: hypothetical protein JSV24_06740 [Bacteroidales bacterium]|nr:MAG: hypothetical protein JSV24_06740 [Bacteroidales bacterium]
MAHRILIAGAFYKIAIYFQMWLKYFSGIVLIAGLLIWQGCSSEEVSNGSLVEHEIDELDEISDQIEEYVTNEKSIFYGLYSPLEVSNMFERIGAVYTPQILNAPENLSNYSTSSEIALNLGIYGVDFSFINMFNQTQDALEYMVVIEKLSDELGIPREVLKIPAKNIERNLANTDSLRQIAITTYATTEHYLKEQGRQSSASLIVLGGWIETLYIATESLYDEENPDPEIVEKIAEQKYSLNSLISFLKNYYDDPVVVYYLRMLKVLKKYFDSYEIYYDIGDVKIDTVNKVIRVSDNRVEISKEIILRIKSIVAKIRDDIVN